MRLTLITPPTGELLPAQELLDWCRADDLGSNRDEVNRLLQAAETSFNEYTGRALRVGTYKWTRSLFSARPMRLPVMPVLDLTEVRYRNDDGDWTVIDADDYQTEVDDVFTYLRPAPLAYWPTVQSERADAVEITFTAGMYASGERPDEEIVRRLKNYVAQCFGKRLPDAMDDEWEVALWLPWSTGELV
jgi:uncharacterized phiE125 gp8 family phage protein